MNFPDLSDVGFGSRVVHPSGAGTNGVLLVGEAPGEVEDRTGIPFHPEAPAGGTLDKILSRAGLRREQFRITNVVWQRPPRNWLDGSPWEARAIEAWRPHLERVIDEMKPKAIVALGNTALKALSSYGGKGASIGDVRGYVLHSNYGAWLVPTFHPSYIMQGHQHEIPVVIRDVLHALEIVKSGFERPPTHYVTFPGLDDFNSWARNYNPERHHLSYDIETPESGKLDEEQVEEEDVSYTIIRMSMCYEGSHAISFPWQEPYVGVAKRLLASHGAKRTWNGEDFDNPRLRAAGCAIRGREHDIMWMWHHLQPTLRRALGYVAPLFDWRWEPWKNLNDSQPEWYSCADSHALHIIAEGCEGALRQTGRWENYQRHVVETSEVLRRMSLNGLPFSPERAKELEIRFQADLEQRTMGLQGRVPESIRPSKQKEGLKKEPKDTSGLSQREFFTLGEDLAPIKVTRWCKVEEFNPASPKQVLSLIRAFGHKAGTNRKTKKETSDEDTLDKLYRRYLHSKKESEREQAQTYRMIIECRQLGKVLGTYIKGWRPGRDGRIHATPGFWGRSYRVSWRKPNIAATIADKKEEFIAAGFRKCITASEGRVLFEVDWKGAEAVLVGWFAGDPDYMRLGKLGVHSYMTALTLADTGRILSSDVPSLEWSDDDLARVFRELKHKFRFEYDQNKHGVHLSNYGGTPFLMWEMYPESFPTKTSAQKWQDFYFGTVAAKVREWQKGVLERAHREAKLSNPFGYVMPFWDVFKWNAKFRRHDLGTDAKSALSFLPRDTLAGMLKEVLIRLRPLADDGVVLTATHDAILGESDEARLGEWLGVVRGEMERPVPELGGLVITTEAKVGACWDEEEMIGDVAWLVQNREQTVAPATAPMAAPLAL